MYLNTGNLRLHKHLGSTRSWISRCRRLCRLEWKTSIKTQREGITKYRISSINKRCLKTWPHFCGQNQGCVQPAAPSGVCGSRLIYRLLNAWWCSFIRGGGFVAFTDFLRSCGPFENVSVSRKHRSASWCCTCNAANWLVTLNLAAIRSKTKNWPLPWNETTKK